MKYYKDINNIVNDMLTIGNETKKREKELMQEEITREKVRQWLGTDNQLEEAIEVIYEIAIGEYSTKMLNKDIMEYYMGNWEYKKEEKSDIDFSTNNSMKKEEE